MTQKQKTLALLAVLASLAAAIGSYAWFGVYRAGEVEKKAKDQADTLFSFKKDEVKQLVVTAKGETTTIVRAGKDGWEISSPIKAPAEKLSVDSLVDKLAGLKRKRVVSNGADLKEYGLESPRIKIVVTLDSGKTHELDVGDDNPYDGTLFAKRGGDADIEICEGGLKYPLEKGLFDLRDKRVFDFDDNALHRLDVATPALAYGLEKGPDGSWKLVAPIQALADSTKVNQIASALRNLRATRFPTEQATVEDLKRFGLDHPGYTVEITLGKDAPGKNPPGKTLTLSEQKEGGTDHVYAKRGDEPWIAEAPSTVLKDLGQSVMDLRDKTLLSFKEAEVTGMAFGIQGKAEIDAERQHTAADGGLGLDSWSLVKPTTGAAKRWKLSSLLSSLQTLKGSSIVAESASPSELEGFGLAKPSKTVKVLGPAGRVLAELLIGKTENNKVYVKSGNSPRVFGVEAYRLSQLPNDAAELVEAPAAKAASDGGAAATPTGNLH